MINRLAIIKDRVDGLSSLDTFKTIVNGKLQELISNNTPATEIKYQILSSPHSDFHTVIAFIHY